MLGEEVREAGRRWGFEPIHSEVGALPDSVRYWLPFPDTVNALRVLKSRYELAIISNVDDGLFALTARYLEVEFDYIITAEQAGTYKPSLGNFELALKRIGRLPRGYCTLPRACSTTTFRPRKWGWIPPGSTEGSQGRLRGDPAGGGRARHRGARPRVAGLRPRAVVNAVTTRHYRRSALDFGSSPAAEGVVHERKHREHR